MSSSSPQRPDGRDPTALRPIVIELGMSQHAEGSARVRWGKTHVWCTASVEETVPRFLRGSRKGWITAEYNMLPRATSSRNERRANLDSGRTHEISRLVGRTLRACANLDLLGERQIRIDGDVLDADGGTRIATLIGGHLALRMAIHRLMTNHTLTKSPLHRFISAVSVGVWSHQVVYDLCYEEDAASQIDGTIVADDHHHILELQMTAEGGALSAPHMQDILQSFPSVLQRVADLQKQALTEYGIPLL